MSRGIMKGSRNTASYTASSAEINTLDYERLPTFDNSVLFEAKKNMKFGERTNTLWICDA